jgi:hypothetical protein
MRSRLNTFRDLVRNEQGSSLVEFAIVATLLVTLVFGIVEFGLVFRDRLTIGNAGQTSARVGTAVGNQPEADYVMLQALEQTLTALPSGGVGIVKYVEFYRADANGNPDGGCPGPNCMKYSYTFVDGPGPLCDWTPCPDPDNFTGWGGPWIPNLRNVQVDNLDVMGVRITFSHTWITQGLLPLSDVSCNAPPGDCWVDTSTMRMEPQQF